MARDTKSSSRRRIASTPTAAFSWNTRPALIDSTMAGVPPSSRWAISGWKSCPSALTYATVPPPTTTGMRFVNSARFATSTPGVPGPPISLCVEMNTAS
jgi:hypothetical protein